MGMGDIRQNQKPETELVTTTEEIVVHMMTMLHGQNIKVLTMLDPLMCDHPLPSRWS